MILPKAVEASYHVTMLVHSADWPLDSET